jgi:hypothetical protein
MTGPAGRWARLELPINLLLLAASIIVLAIGLALPSGLLAGAGMFGSLFFAVYSIYAYVRRR